MTRKQPHQLLSALRESLAGRQKLVAHETWPGANDAEARMSRVLSGELNPPPELIVLALRGPGGAALLDYFRRVAEGDPAELRRQVLGELVQMRGQLELCFDAIERADDAERDRAQMVRVEARRPADRRHA